MSKIVTHDELLAASSGNIVTHDQLMAQIAPSTTESATRGLLEGLNPFGGVQNIPGADTVFSSMMPTGAINNVIEAVGGGRPLPLDYGKQAAESLDRGTASALDSVAGAAQYARDLRENTGVTLSPLEMVAPQQSLDASQQYAQDVQKRSARSTGSLEPANPLWYVESAGETAPQMAGQIGSAALSGGGSLAFAATSLPLVAGSHYRQALQRGASEEIALAESSIVAPLTAALDLIPGAVYDAAGGLGIKTAIGEGVQAVVARTVPDLVKRYGAKPLLTGGGAVAEGFTEYLQGVVADAVNYAFERDESLDPATAENQKKYLGEAIIGAVMGGATASSRSAVPEQSPPSQDLPETQSDAPEQKVETPAFTLTTGGPPTDAEHRLRARNSEAFKRTLTPEEIEAQRKRQASHVTPRVAETTAYENSPQFVSEPPQQVGETQPLGSDLEVEAPAQPPMEAGQNVQNLQALSPSEVEKIWRAKTGSTKLAPAKSVMIEQLLGEQEPTFPVAPALDDAQIAAVREQERRDMLAAQSQELTPEQEAFLEPPKKSFNDAKKAPAASAPQSLQNAPQSTQAASVAPEPQQAETQQEAIGRVKMAGAEFDLVRKNEDGTITVRNANGDEFDSEPGEQYTELSVPEKAPPQEVYKTRKRDFVEGELQRKRDARKASLLAAEAKAAEFVKGKGIKLPVGVSASQTLQLMDRRKQGKEGRAIAAELSVAKGNLEASEATDRATYENVHKRLVDDAISKGLISDHPDYAPKKSFNDAKKPVVVSERGQTALPGLEEEAAAMEKRDAEDAATLADLASLRKFGDDFTLAHKPAIDLLRKKIAEDKTTVHGPDFIDDDIEALLPTTDDYDASAEQKLAMSQVAEREVARATPDISKDVEDTFYAPLDKADPVGDLRKRALGLARPIVDDADYKSLEKQLADENEADRILDKTRDLLDGYRVNGHRDIDRRERVKALQQQIDSVTDAENEAFEQADPRMAARKAAERKIAEIDAAEAEATKALSREKAALKKGRRKEKNRLIAEVEQKWQAVKDEASKKRQEEYAKLRKEIEGLTPASEKEAEAERTRQRRAEAERREAEQAEQEDRGDWQKVQDMGGADKARAMQEQAIKKARTRLKMTKESNKWKVEREIARHERDLARLSELEGKFASGQNVQPPVSPRSETPDVSETPAQNAQETPKADTPASDAFSRIESLASTWEAQANKDIGGNGGLAVGAENINYRWKADAMRSLVQRVKSGTPVERAVEETKAEAREWIAKHNARRPKDVNWQRWEGSVDDSIETAWRMIAQEKKVATESESGDSKTLPHRATPRKGTPEREALDAARKQWDAEHETAYEAVEEARKAYDKAKYGTKKQEQAEKKLEKARAKLEEVNNRQDKRSRLPYFEDAVEEAPDEYVREFAIEQLNQHLRGLGEKPAIKEKGSAYETAKKAAAAIAKDQGLDEEAANSVGFNTAQYLHAFPKRGETLKSVAQRLIDSHNEESPYRKALDELDKLDIPGRSDIRRRLDTYKREPERINAVMQEARDAAKLKADAEEAEKKADAKAAKDRAKSLKPLETKGSRKDAAWNTKNKGVIGLGGVVSDGKIVVDTSALNSVDRQALISGASEREIVAEGWREIVKNASEDAVPIGADENHAYFRSGDRVEAMDAPRAAYFTRIGKPDSYKLSRAGDVGVIVAYRGGKPVWASTVLEKTPAIDLAELDKMSKTEESPEQKAERLSAEADRLYTQIEQLQDEGKSAEAGRLIKEAEAKYAEAKKLDAPLLRAEKEAKEKADAESREARLKVKMDEDAKRVASLPRWQQRNGWEIVRDGTDYVLRDPSDKSEVYRNHKLTRVREVADEGDNPTASQAAQEKAEAARPEFEALGTTGGGKWKGQRIRNDFVPESVKASRPEVEERIQRAKGIKKRTWAEWGKEVGTALAHKATRTYEHLPATDPKFAVARENLRLYKTIVPNAQDKAARDIAAIVDPMGPKQLEVFTRKLMYDNALRSAELGQRTSPFGMNGIDEIRAEKEKVDRIAEQIPEVKEALDTRQKIATELVNELKSLGLIGDDVSSDEYYHQQVLIYHKAMGGLRGLKKKKKGFQKKRSEGLEDDEALDYNTDYIQSEAEWMADAHTVIAREKIWRGLQREYDKTAELEAEAEKKGVTLQEVLKGRPDLDQFYMKPGNTFYKAFTVPEKIVEELHKNMVAELSVDELREVWALAKAPKAIMPKELVDQLDSMEKAKPSGPVGEFFDGLLAGWKGWSTVVSPKRWIKYQLSNTTGDLDPVVGGAPETMYYVPQAIQELKSYYLDNKLPTSGTLKSAVENGVLSASFTAEEVSKFKDLPIFKRLDVEPKTIAAIPKDAMQWYYDTVRKGNEMRESVMRYAAFLHYKNALEKGMLKHYGASRKSTVDVLKDRMGTDVAAAHLSRNLLGDYGDITLMGQWLRKHLIPFHSFQEINLKRLPMLAVNAVQAGGARGLAKASPSAAAQIAAKSALLTMRIGAIYGLAYAWNNMLFGDEEEELDDRTRAKPHIVLGRNADGSIRVANNIGAMGDIFEWWGGNNLGQNVQKWRNGQIEFEDVVDGMWGDFLNKLAGGVRPDAKGLYEVTTGQSLFPDIRNPRSARRDDLAAGIFGVTDEWRAVRGAALGDGSRAKNNYFQSFAWTVSDPRANALSEMYELRSDYNKKKGKDNSGASAISKFQNARYAARSGDYDQFADWRSNFLKNEEPNMEKAVERFMGLLDRLDPIDQLSEEDAADFEQNFLTAAQRERLLVSRAYSKEQRDTLLTWWEAASRESDTPEQRAIYETAMKKHFLNKRKMALGRGRPEKQPSETTEEFQERRKTWRRKQGEAKRYLAENEGMEEKFRSVR